MSQASTFPGVGKYGHYQYNNPPAATTNPRQIAKDNVWAGYFGLPQRAGEMHSYDNKDVTTWALPEALKGESNFFGNTFEILALTNNSFLTSYILPIRKTKALRSNWSRWEFVPHLCDNVPVRGIVRLVKSNRQAGGVSFVRWGIGGMWEHGFMNTELGRAHFAMNLRQINQAINETLQFDALYVIAMAEDETINYLRTHELERNKKNKIKHVMQRELDYWAILQQEKNAWKIMDSMIKRDVEKYNPRRLTTYITDSRASVYLALRPDEKNNYYKGGKPISAVQDGVEAFYTDELGQRVYTTRSFLVDEEDPINPLESKVEIGEFFKCYDTHDNELHKYTSKTREQQFYDQSADDMKSIKLLEKLIHCNRFNRDGKLYSFDDPEAMRYGTKEYSTKEKSFDFLHYYDSNGKLSPVKYFGQIQHHYLNFDDYNTMAQTVINRISHETGKPKTYFQDAIDDLREALNIMVNIEFNSNFNQFLRNLARNNSNDRLTQNPDPSIPPQLRIYELPANEFGSWNVPDSQGITMALPPTHATYGGMKTIRKHTLAGNTKGFNETWMKRISNAIEIFDKFVKHLVGLFPGSLLLNSKWASNYVHNASPAHVLFENLVASKYPTRPIFVRRPQGSPGSITDTETANGDLSIINSILPSASVARTRLMRSLVGKRASGNYGSGNDIGSRLNDFNKYDKMDTFQTSDALSNFISQLKSDSGDAGKTFQELKQWVFMGINGTSHDTLIKSQTDLALILGTLLFIRIDYNDIEGTMNRFKSVLDQLKTLNVAHTSGKYFNINNRTTFVDAMIKFFNGREDDLLQRGLKTDVIKQYYNTTIKKSENSNIKQTLKAELSKSSSTTNQSNQNLNNSSSVSSGGSSNNNNNSSLPSTQQQQQQQQQFTTGIPEFSGLDRGGQDYYRAPIVMGQAALRSFVDFNRRNISTGNVIYGYPASTINPATFVTLQELNQAHEEAELLLKSNNASRINSMIGRQIHPTLIPSNTGYVGNDISHLPFIQKANELQNTGAYDSEYDRKMEMARKRELQKQTSGSRRQIVPGVNSLPIGSSLASGLHSNKFLDEVAQNRLDNVELSNIPLNERTNMTAKRRRKNKFGESIDGFDIDDIFQDTPQSTSIPMETSNIQLNKSNSSNIDAFINEQLSGNMRKVYQDIMKHSSGIVNIIAIVFLTTEVTLDFMKSTITNNLMHPFNYIVARPHARYRTLQITKCIPGVETGRVNMGHIKTEVGDDINTGVHLLNVTFYAKAEITNSKNIYNVHNAMVVGYDGGLDSGFFSRERYDPGNGEYGDETDSIFIFAIPRHEKLSSNPITLDGKYDWVDGSAYNIEAIRAGAALNYSTAPFYSGFWGFSTNKLWNTRLKPEMYKKYVGDKFIPNSTMFSSLALYYNPTNGKFDKSTSQTGHWRNSTVGRGMHRARIGKGAFINDPTRGILHGTSALTN